MTHHSCRQHQPICRLGESVSLVEAARVGVGVAHHDLDLRGAALAGNFAAGSGIDGVNPPAGVVVPFYLKDAPSGFSFPIPTEPVLLDQDKCRYSPRVLGVRVGQPLQIRNSDPLLHNVRSNAVINQAFNKSTPVEGMTFDHAFATREVMVPFKCDVHGWMNAYAAVLDNPFFAVTGPDGKFELKGLPPGTYTIEAWQEKLGATTASVTIGAK